jgi:hypothetical protein
MTCPWLEPRSRRSYFLKLKEKILSKFSDASFEEDNFSDDCDVEVHISLVKGEVQFFKNGCELSRLEYSCNHDKELEEHFGRAFVFKIGVTKMKFFTLRKRIDFTIKEIMENVLEERAYEELNSYTYLKKHSRVEIIKNGDILNDKFMNYAKNSIARFTRVICDMNCGDRKKSLILSHFYNICPGLTDCADVSWFKGKESYYYVKWIENHVEREEDRA